MAFAIASAIWPGGPKRSITAHHRVPGEVQSGLSPKVQASLPCRWLGIVPRQYSTGGKMNLPGVSKRGKVYPRKTLIHDARATVLRIERDRVPIGASLVDSLVPIASADSRTTAGMNTQNVY